MEARCRTIPNAETLDVELPDGTRARMTAAAPFVVVPAPPPGHEFVVEQVDGGYQFRFDPVTPESSQ